MRIIILYIIILIFPFLSYAADDSILTLPNVSTVDFKTYKTDIPTAMEHNKITIENIGGPIPADNKVNFKINNTAFVLTCDGTTQNFPGGLPPEKPNTMKCTVDRSGNFYSGTAVDITVLYYNPNTFSNSKSEEPGKTDFNISETNAANPYCNSEQDAQVCKWQEKNTNITSLNDKGVPLNNWVVFSKINFKAKIGYPIDTSVFKGGEVLCVKDTNSNGRYDQIEYLSCYPGNPTTLCPYDATKCDPPIAPTCSDKGSTPSGALDRCVSPVSCGSPGTYDNSTQQCKANAYQECDKSKPPVCTWKCPTGYSLRSLGYGLYICMASPYCPIGSLNYNNGYYCDTGPPTCPSGSYNTTYDACYRLGYPCPYGRDILCTNATGFNEPMCSPLPCNSVENDGSPQGTEDLNNDAPTDSGGNCTGNLYIFNGKDRRCRSGGVNTGFENCCSDSAYFFNLFRCNAEESDLAKKKEKELCIYVGEYCSRKLSFLGGSVCLETKKTYCCYNSKLAKLIQEQGRPQLRSFNQSSLFGSAKRPVCRGFTPDEFQSLNFSKIDLSSWYRDIETSSQQQVQDTMSDRINDFFQR